MRFTIAQKLVSALSVLIAVSFILLTSIHLAKQYDMNLKQGELLARSESAAYTNMLQRQADHTVWTLQALRTTMLENRREPDRSRVIDLMQDLLKDKSYLLNLYAMWEPDAFDGRDGDYRNGGEGASGRFNPYVGIQGSRLFASSLERERPGASGDYYEIPKRTMRLSLLDPYYETVNGVALPIASIVLPVTDTDGTFLGVVGADLSLAAIQYGIERIKPFGGYAALVSAGKLYAANGLHPDRLGKPYEPWSKDAAPPDVQTSGSKLYTPGEDGEGQALRLFYPLRIGETTWRFEMVVPKKNMLAGYYESLEQTVVIALAALFALMGLMILLIKKVIVKNIIKVVQVSADLAKGNVHHKLDIRTHDEFELMAAYFNRMLDYRSEAEQLVHYQATHDLLTGLPNRYGYNRHVLGRAAAGKGTGHTALLFIDLDRFKVVNDKLDYSMGDLLLKRVAQRIVNTIEGRGTAFRFGSDEFIVLLENVGSVQQANLTAEDLLLTIARPIRLDDRIFYITASIGMSLQPELNGETGEQLVKEADVALYMAKKQRNTCKVYAVSMNEMPQKEAALENGLYTALKNNEFMLYYQPKVELVSGRIYGAEALIRWRHPEFGMVSPLEFIPLAEKTGFIIPLGEWVLREACRQIKVWDGLGLSSLLVSVNMSMLQFQQKDIVHTIERIISEEGVDPERIELELTESIFMDNPEHTLRILHKLKRLGVHLSLDDFGTGYSSLSYLQSVPIHYLKLDKTFIHDIVKDYRKQMIFKALVVIAHNLDLKVVTEGVETPEELSIIKNHQCDSVQGYLYSPPVPPDRFEELYKRNIA